MKGPFTIKRKECSKSKSQPAIPEGYESIIPHLVCEKCTEAIEFYRKAFGAEELYRLPTPDGRIMHAALRIGKSILFLVDDFPEFCGGQSSSAKLQKGTPVTFRHYSLDCDAAVKQAVAAGAEVVMPPADMFWGDRYGVVKDPWGHRWSFGTKIKDLGTAEMQSAMKEAFAQKR